VSASISLRGRLVGLAAAFCVAFLAFAALAFVTLNRVAVNGPVYDEIISGKDLIADILPPPQYIIESYLLVHQLLEATSDTEKRDLIARGNALRAEFDIRHAHWEDTMPTGQLRETMLVDAHRPALEFFERRDNEFIPAILAGDNLRARTVLSTSLRPRYESHRAAVDSVVQQTLVLNQAAEEAAANAIRAGNSWMVILGLLSTALVLVMVFLADMWTRKLSTDLQTAAETAQKVASGDLVVKLGATGDDESGRLLHAIAQMAGSLAQLVARAQRSSIDLLSTAAELAATSREQDATVAGFGASTSQIAAAVTEISATSRELLGTMNDVSRVAAEAASLAQSGRAGLDRMDATMAHLARSTNAVTARLSSIQEKAADINMVVTTITKVADQTNLLSINAAIEAEKAGEYGIGFLVLAREIRRLADQTAVATLDIENIVKQMQSAVTAGVMEMDRFSAEVRGGVGTVAQIGSQLGEIIAQVTTLSERFELVNDGMRSQSEGARQIKDAMAQLTDGARQTAASLGEFKIVTENLRESATGLRASIADFRVEE
jgi:methyl-accepting chemotaxis protein WspA